MRGRSGSQATHSGPARSASRSLGYTALMATFFWFCSFWMWGLFERLGVPESFRGKMPVVGICAGLALGAATFFSETATRLVRNLGLVLLSGIGLWCCSLLVGALLDVMGVSPSISDPVPTIGFWIGILLGVLAIFTGSGTNR